MNTKILNPFIDASVNVLKTELNAHIEQQDLVQEKGMLVSDDVTVIIGVTGGVEGQVFIGMNQKTAKGIISMMMGEELEEFDEIAKSGIAEIGNVILGHAASSLESNGYMCNISSPTLICKDGTMIHTINSKRISIPLMTQFGLFTIYVALREASNDED